MRPLSLLLLAVLSSSLFAGPRGEPTRFEGRAVILHPARALSDADRAELAAAGVNIRQALSGGRYLARVADEAAVASDARVRAIETLTPEKKLHHTAVRQAVSGRTHADIHVIFDRGVPFDEARQVVLAAGGAMEDVFATDYLPSQRIEAQIAPHALTALASDDRVVAVAGGRALKLTTDNATTATLSHVRELHEAPYGLTGAGVAVSLFELAEAQGSHVEFGGRLTVAPTTVGGSSGDKRHATHVAGTIGASGVRADAKGMAPGVKIEQFCVRNPETNQCSGGWQSLKDTRLHPLNVVADNNSWGYIWGWQDGASPIWNEGDKYWGAYDLVLTAPIDEIAIERDILFVHSAGNDGSVPVSLRVDPWKMHRHVDPDTLETLEGQTFCVSQNGSGTDCPASCNGKKNPCELQLHHPQTPYDTLGTTAAAKNVLSVGAVDSALNIIGFSSRGPAKDGRVKPELVARGSSVMSSVPTNSYGTSSGTSMSAPAVTGMAALLTEQWRRTFAGANPGAAMLKALLIAGTADLGPRGPDYTFGFGLANAKNSVDMILADGGAGRRIRRFTFANGASSEQEMTVLVRQQQDLRFVLNWNDPATPMFGADEIAAKALVNDLDLRVIDPAGNTHLPYILDKNNPNALATRGVNSVDNTEMVEIPNAMAGTYRVVVAGKDVREGPQHAVVVSSARLRPCVDVQESNDVVERAWGNIVSGAFLNAGLCSAGDVDFFKFLATRTGPLSVSVTAGDTPLRVTVTGNGISQTREIAAEATETVSATSNVAPNAIVVKVEAAGPIGPESSYRLIATYQETKAPRRRSARH